MQTTDETQGVVGFLESHGYSGGLHLDRGRTNILEACLEDFICNLCPQFHRSRDCNILTKLLGLDVKERDPPVDDEIPRPGNDRIEDKILLQNVIHGGVVNSFESRFGVPLSRPASEIGYEDDEE